MEASIRRYSDVVKLLLDCGAQVDLRNKCGSTSLMLARKNGNNDIVKLLLDSGAQIDLIDNGEHTVQEKIDSLVRRGEGGGENWIVCMWGKP